MDAEGAWHDNLCDSGTNLRQYLCETDYKALCEFLLMCCSYLLLLILGFERIQIWSFNKFFWENVLGLAGCASGYEEHGGKCYKHVTTTATGDAAQAACVADGANLVSIEDAAENDYVNVKFG